MNSSHHILQMAVILRIERQQQLSRERMKSRGTLSSMQDGAFVSGRLILQQRVALFLYPRADYRSYDGCVHLVNFMDTDCFMLKNLVLQADKNSPF
jgi:hypothetical protein